MRRDRPSATAGLVAAATIMAALDGLEPAPLARSVEIARLLLGGSRLGRALRTSVEWRIGREWWRAVERAITPGFVQHIARRKAWLWEQCARAVGEGCTRFIVLGAGLDALGIGLAESDPRLEVVEIDHPRTHALKRRLMESVLPPRLLLVAADLGSPEGLEALAGLGDWVRGRSTMVVAEGLLMYLPLEKVVGLLAAVSALPAAGLRLASTFMEPDGKGRIAFRVQGRLADLWLRVNGEPFLWGAARGKVVEMLARMGWNVPQIVDEHDLAARWPGRVLDGEVLAVAERAGASVVGFGMGKPADLTWAGLLGQWTMFAKASVALPKNAEGERWRAAVAPIVELQAVTFALGDLPRLKDAGERALGIDRAEILVKRSSEALAGLWRGETVPSEVGAILGDAAAALAAAKTGGAR